MSWVTPRWGEPSPDRPWKVGPPASPPRWLIGGEVVIVPGRPLSDQPFPAGTRRAVTVNAITLAVLAIGLVLVPTAALVGLFALGGTYLIMFLKWALSPPPMTYALTFGSGQLQQYVADRAADLVAYEREQGHQVWIEATTPAGVFYWVRESPWHRSAQYWVRPGSGRQVVLMRLLGTSPGGGSGTWVRA